MVAAPRLIFLADLLREWRRRLGDLHRLIIDPRGLDRWLSEIRARVLTFLLSRYGERARGAEEGVALARIERRPRDAFCAVTPEYHPPRVSGQLRPLLMDLRRQKELSRPRWRFWP